MDAENLSFPTPPSDPHPAILLSLPYFALRELLSSQMVCRQLRDAIATDPLIWCHLTVTPPLSLRINDDVLLQLTSRAAGRLESLALLNCWSISVATLWCVARQNPNIQKLYIPGCTQLTASGVMTVIKQLSQSKGLDNLRRLRLYAIRDVTQEHLDIYRSILSRNRNEEALQPSLHRYPFSDNDDGPPIDVDMCPKCKRIGLVFDCTRGDCRLMRTRRTECQGCYFCIPRCEDCGGCINFDELGTDTACSHLLCGDCWLRRPKCNLCNKPYCHKHSEFGGALSGSLGFVCEQCKELHGSSGFSKFGNF